MKLQVFYKPLSLYSTSNKAKLNQAEALFINSYPFRTGTNAYLGIIAGYGVI